MTKYFYFTENGKNIYTKGKKVHKRRFGGCTTGNQRKKISIRKAHKKYNIDKSLLSRRSRGIEKKVPGRKTALSKEIEEDLADKLKVLAKWGFALSRKEILSTVQDFVQENELKITVFRDGKPGKDWFVGFCKRNKLSLKKIEQLEACRYKATSDPFIIYNFYDILEATLKKFNLEASPDAVWNLDETYFSSDPTRVRGVAGRGQKVHRRIAGSGKENTTVMACISAAGTVLPPLVIFQGSHLWSSWKGDKDLKGNNYYLKHTELNFTQAIFYFRNNVCMFKKRMDDM